MPAGARRGLVQAQVVAALAGAGRSGPIGELVAGASSGVASPGVASPAAVLVATFDEGGEARVLLTRRAAGLRSHRGEVSLPGGRVEPGEHVVAAALREAEEEIGLAPPAVTPVGWLHPVSTVSSQWWITPVVGVLDRRPEVRPNAAEVARVFDVALADLLADGAFHEERWTVPGRPAPAVLPARPGGPSGSSADGSSAGGSSADGSFPVWFFDVATETVWGATARILVDLLSTVLGVGG
ncbi:MAG: NUDIX hydrolase [Acidimicrobiales bacterium]